MREYLKEQIQRFKLFEQWRMLKTNERIPGEKKREWESGGGHLWWSEKMEFKPLESRRVGGF